MQTLLRTCAERAGTRVFAELLVSDASAFEVCLDPSVGPDTAKLIAAYGTKNRTGFRLWFWTPAPEGLDTDRNPGWAPFDLHYGLLSRMYYNMHAAKLCTEEQYIMRQASLRVGQARVLYIEQQAERLVSAKYKNDEQPDPDEHQARCTAKCLQLTALMPTVKAPAHSEVNDVRSRIKVCHLAVMERQVLSLPDLVSMVLDRLHQLATEPDDVAAAAATPAQFRGLHWPHANFAVDLGDSMPPIPVERWLNLPAPHKTCAYQRDPTTYHAFPYPSLAWELYDVASVQDLVDRLFPWSFSPVDLMLARYERLAEMAQEYVTQRNAYEMQQDRAGGSIYQSLGTGQHDLYDWSASAAGELMAAAAAADGDDDRMMVDKPVAPAGCLPDSTNLSAVLGEVEAAKTTTDADVLEHVGIAIPVAGVASASNRVRKNVVKSRIVTLAEEMDELSARIEHVVNLMPTILMRPTDHNIPLALLEPAPGEVVAPLDDSSRVGWTAKAREYFRRRLRGELMALKKQHGCEALFAMLAMNSPDNAGLHLELSALLGAPDGLNLHTPVYSDPRQLPAWCGHVVMRLQMAAEAHNIVLAVLWLRIKMVILVTMGYLKAPARPHTIVCGPAGSGKSFTTETAMETSLGQTTSMTYASALAEYTGQLNDLTITQRDEVPPELGGDVSRMNNQEKAARERRKETTSSNWLTYMRNVEGPDKQRITEFLRMSHYVIELINANEVADTPTTDPAMASRFRMVLTPNYDVTNENKKATGLVSRLLREEGLEIDGLRASFKTTMMREHALQLLLAAAIDLHALPKPGIALGMMMLDAAIGAIADYTSVDQANSRGLARYQTDLHAYAITNAAYAANSEMSPLIKRDKDLKITAIQPLDRDAMHAAFAPLLFCGPEHCMFALWSWMDEELHWEASLCLLLLASHYSGYTREFYTKSYARAGVAMPHTLQRLCERSSRPELQEYYTQIQEMRRRAACMTELLGTKVTDLPREYRADLSAHRDLLEQQCVALEQRIWDEGNPPIFLRQLENLYRQCAVDASVHCAEGTPMVTPTFDTTRTADGKATLKYYAHRIRIDGTLQTNAYRAEELFRQIGIRLGRGQIMSALVRASRRDVRYPVYAGSTFERSRLPGDIEILRAGKTVTPTMSSGKLLAFHAAVDGQPAYMTVLAHALNMGTHRIMFDMMCAAETEHTRPQTVLLPVAPLGFDQVLQTFDIQPNPNNHLMFCSRSASAAALDRLGDVEPPSMKSARMLMPTSCTLINDSLKRLHANTGSRANHTTYQFEEPARAAFREHLIATGILPAHFAIGTVDEQLALDKVVDMHPHRPGAPELVLSRIWADMPSPPDTLPYPFNVMENLARAALEDAVVAAAPVFLARTLQADDWATINKLLVEFGVLPDILPKHQEAGVEHMRAPAADAADVRRRRMELIDFSSSLYVLSMVVRKLLAMPGEPRLRAARIYSCIQTYYDNYMRYKNVLDQYAHIFKPPTLGDVPATLELAAATIKKAKDHLAASGNTLLDDEKRALEEAEYNESERKRRIVEDTQPAPAPMEADMDEAALAALKAASSAILKSPHHQQTVNPKTPRSWRSHLADPAEAVAAAAAPTVVTVAGISYMEV
jgi:hypothetical protein